MERRTIVADDPDTELVEGFPIVHVATDQLHFCAVP